MKLIPQSRMRRILVLLLGGLFVALLSGGWFVSIFLDVDRAREAIAEEMSRRLHRRVSLGGLSVGFFFATLRHIVIFDREGFSGEPFLKVYSVRARVDPWELVRGRLVLVIPDIRAKNPVVVIKRNADGELNVADLLNPREAQRGARDGRRGTEEGGRVPRPSPLVPRPSGHRLDAVEIKELSFSNGTAKFVNLASKAVTLISGVSGSGSIELQSKAIVIKEARIRSQTLSIQADAEVSRDLKQGRATVRLADFDLMTFKPYLAFLSGFEGGRLLLQNAIVKGKADDGVVTVDQLSLCPNGGTLAGTGKVWWEEGKPAFHVEASFQDVQLDPFLWQTRTDQVSFGGTCEGTCSISGKGLWMDDLKKALSGTAELHVKQGRFQNKVLIKIGIIKDEIMGLRSLTRGRFDDFLNRLEDLDDGQVSKMQDSGAEYRADARGTFQIGDAKITSTNLRFDSHLFDVYMAAPGYWTFDGDMRLPKVMLHAGDEKGSLDVPLKIKGSVKRPRVDVEWTALRRTLIGK